MPSISDIASIATIGAFLVTLISLAFSAKKYLDIKKREEEIIRFETYHKLIKTISKGTDEDGLLKLVSQLAYIYELRNFPEYKVVTINTLHILEDDWSKNNKKQQKQLKISIQDTICFLEKK